MTIKDLFKLPLRQTTGMVASLMKLAVRPQARVARHRRACACVPPSSLSESAHTSQSLSEALRIWWGVRGSNSRHFRCKQRTLRPKY
ncbi:hypothetical protein G0Q02_16880 [Epibacterium mobile]|nr:hypothetical protein [Tritonibacter mobilis]NHM24540.1 hypothetical protein [Tritonibacter mobilis]